MEAYKEIVKKINQSFRDVDTEAFLVHCIEDVTWSMTCMANCKGKTAIREMLKNAPQTPPVFTEDVLIAEGNRVVCTGAIEMDNQDGSLFKGEYCDVYLFEDGKVKELKSYMLEFKDANN